MNEREVKGSAASAYVGAWMRAGNDGYGLQARRVADDARSGRDQALQRLQLACARASVRGRREGPPPARRRRARRLVSLVRGIVRGITEPSREPEAA